MDQRAMEEGVTDEGTVSKRMMEESDERDRKCRVGGDRRRESVGWLWLGVREHIKRENLREINN